MKDSIEFFFGVFEVEVCIGGHPDFSSRKMGRDGGTDSLRGLDKGLITWDEEEGEAGNRGSGW